MIADQPTEGINSLVIAEDRSLRFEQKVKNELGRGAFGVVYRGTFEGNAVAVKVIDKVHSDAARKKDQKREMEEHFRLDHENVVKLLHVDDSRSRGKTCLVLELCAGTLKDYCEKKYNGPELPPTGPVLYQIANGLHYIHSRNLVHRDVKPDNILISMTTPVQMKLSDFGFVKKISPQGTFTQSELKGTPKWMAPEILLHADVAITELPRGSIQSDTFAAGCVFFYFLTGGKHPFGDSFEIPVNILKNNPIELNQNKQITDWQGLYKLIGKMIKPKDERISLSEVIEQLTATFFASRQFKRVARLSGGGMGWCAPVRPVARLVREIDGYFVSRFHPKKFVLACGAEDKIIFFSAENLSIPFSDWKEDEKKFQIGHVEGITIEEITTMEWNADGTQLAAIFNENVIVCWRYPSGKILFKNKLNEDMNRIEWNPLRPNVFAIFREELGYEKVLLFNSRSVDQRPFHFYTIQQDIRSFQWISKNRLVLGFQFGGKIEIWEIDESTAKANVVKRFQNETGLITDMAWDEKTKCLAACSRDGWMTIWSMGRDQPIHNIEVDGFCYCLAWRPNGKQTDGEGAKAAARKSADNFILVCGLDEGRIFIWTPLDSKDKKKILFSSQHKRSKVVSLSFSPDGRFLASKDGNGKWIIWSTEDWDPVFINEGEGCRVRPFSWLSSSTDVPDYKLFYESTSSGGKNAPSASKKFQAKITREDEEIANEKETGGEYSIGSRSCDLY